MLKSVEKYDPVLNKWDYVADMNITRYAYAACVLQDKIYVVGGFDSKNYLVKEVERYDPSCDKWIIVDIIEDKLCNHALVVV